ncbi:plexin-D1 isoform X2 [Sceloporus undulatus]|uniref:plexin-D1 isoform X2 n=1 Tax=Sceloporus undulatus TaxID=8520 RepID=UPI001C4B66E1|nr:plexin-D1 isoform X2 [Sceloporus undulatus]
MGGRRRAAGERRRGAERAPPGAPWWPLVGALLLWGFPGGCRALEVEHRFLSPTATNNFALGPAKVYLASVNRLFQLSGPNLSLEAWEALGPEADSPLCHAPQLPQASCEHPKRPTDNYNKLLQPDPEQGLLVVCGSLFQGFCQLRSLDNISVVAVAFPPGAGEEKEAGAGGSSQAPVTVFPSMLNVAANHANASTVGLVLRRRGGLGTRLLVAATYTGLGSPFFPRNASLEDHRFENTPEIAIRSLEARGGDPGRLFTFDINPSDDNVFKIKQGAKERHKLSFVRAFLHRGSGRGPPSSAEKKKKGKGTATEKGAPSSWPRRRSPAYAYLALNSEANAREKESPSQSLLARICLGDAKEEEEEEEGEKEEGAAAAASLPVGETKKLTESYIQMGLQCSSAGGELFNRLVSVFPAQATLHLGSQGGLPAPPEPQELLFGVFEKSSPSSSSSGGRPGAQPSALCAFRFAQIEEAIRVARNSCFVAPDARLVTVLDSVVQGTGPACERRKIQLQPEQLDCGAAHLQHPLSILQPIKAKPVFTSPGLTSVAVSSVNNYTVVFLGTVNGRLLKINLNSSMDVMSRESITVAYSEPVHPVMQFDPSDSSYLYLMTSHQIARVKVAACNQYTVCTECLAAADAYCGWCTLETRCSLQHECANSDEPYYWISASEGVQQCPSMTIIPSEINIEKENTGMIIQINGNIPSLNGMKMSCDYGNNIETVAKVLTQPLNQYVYCNFLPREKYPAFPSNQDHVIVQTAVRVNGKNIVQANFTIYDCKRTGNIYPKTACISCFSAKWKCHWCTRKYTCVSNATECADSIQMNNSTDCPQIVPASVAPVSTGDSQDIAITLMNAAFIKEMPLECHFETDRVFEARWINSSAVQCNNVQLHTSDKRHLFLVNLQLKEKPGRFIDSPQMMTVEIYNCATGSADCSQCLGREDLGHQCIWSDSSSSCRLNTEALQIPGTCPPPEIRKIEPLSGPLEGGTMVTIRGRNLGRRFSDIVNAVKIGNVKCSPLQERYIVSEEIVCWTGEAVEEFSDVVTVNLSKEGKSRERYSYVLPVVKFMSPSTGPKAGGTKVTITGSNLSVGSELRVLVNGTKECTDLSRTDTTITCTMPSVEFTTTASVCVQFENKSCIGDNNNFNYEKNPSIMDINPKKSQISGGRIITVEGNGFLMAQNVSMVVHTIGKGQTNCKVHSDTVITCPSPAASNLTGSKPASVDFYINGRLYTDDNHFPFDHHEEAVHISKFHLEYYPDPQFFTAKKEKWIKHHPGEPLTLVIHKEPDSLGLESNEYEVKIGLISCEIQIVSDKVIHCSVNESLNTSERQLPVTIQVGKFNQTIAMLHLGGSETAITVSIVICSILLLLSVVALFVFCTKSRRAERYWQKTLLQMEEMESQIREEIRKGFAELQTDMTDLTKELNRSQGIPFLEYKYFVTRTFFPKCSSLYEERYILPSQHLNTQMGSQVQETHPLLLGEWKIPENCRPNMEEGIALFSTLLNNKHFLIVFVHALEQQKDFAVRDRCNLASLLTIALHGKLEYYTSIMKDLLVDLIDASASKNPKLMLRRTESVVEKMLTNWMSICMYSFLRETVGEPFFLLLCAIKQQINKGSIDAITGKARYTLNEEWLLRENIEAKPRNLNVSFQGCGMDSLSVRVMDTDTLSQVKEKILEAFCKNIPYSQWPRVEDVDLEWFATSTDSYILRDLDDTSVMEDGRKKLNTLAHYKIPDGASLAMSLTDNKDTTLSRVKDLDTEKYFHLVLPTDELNDNKKSHRQSHRKKVLPEIYLTRLLSTKGTLQKFLDDLFKAILSIRDEKPPVAIKYFFDFLEEQAEKRGISDPDTLHIWKTNSLPLRFWVNILKNPQFVFDIDKTDHIDACLSVIAQAFIDACSISDLQLGKDSPTNKLLYAKEIPEYRKIVQKYYKQIHDMPPLSEQEMNAHLAEESRKYRNEFNTNVAMTEIYKYAKRYRSQIVNALDSNPTTRRTQLQHKFEQVIALMEDNIYECCSEA